MYRKLNIKILALIFSVLLLVVVLTELADSRKGGRTFREDLVDVDAEKVSLIEIKPRVTGGTDIKLYKENDQWIVESEDKKYKADQSSASSLINELNSIKPESVVATSSDRWEQYEVTDSLGTRLKLFEGNQLLADLIIGKFSFSQPRKMTSYVRVEGEKEVYGVNGMLGMSFNRDIDSFRDRTVISSNPSDWTRLVFTYPADSSFTLEKAAEGWVINGQVADSASVADYYNTIRNINEGSFTDFVPSIQATHKLKIEGNNDMIPLEITGYWQGNEDVVVESSQNKGNMFKSKDLAEKIFVSSSQFLK